jgi:two-component system, LytTR family, response regulator LytT
MIKALVIEDEDLAANRLINLLQQIEPDIDIAGPIDSVEQTILYLQKNQQPDLLFLDIQLADGKSFSIFDQVKVNVPIIFTTAYDEYAIRAFELNSIDYLLKPVSLEKLRAALDKFKKISAYYQHDNFNGQLNSLLQSIKLQAEPTYKTRFLVNKGDVLLPITVDETAYFYAEDKAVFLVTAENKKYLINFSLEELEDKLDPKLFFRVNRQFICSIKAIFKAHNYFNYRLKLALQPEPGTEVIVSKSKTSEFKAWMER